MAQRQMEQYLRETQQEPDGPPEAKRLHLQADSPLQSQGESAGHVAGGEAGVKEAAAITVTLQPGESAESQSGAGMLEGLPAAVAQHMAVVLQQAGWKPPASTPTANKPTTTCKQTTLTSLEPGEIDTADNVQGDLADELNAFEMPEEAEEMDIGDDLLEEITQVYQTEEELAEDLPPAAANLINKALRTAISQTREKELLDKFKRPGNCPSLVVPRVNTEVWKTLQRRTKEMDISLQKVQLALHKGLIPLARVLTSLKDKKDKDNLKLVLESLQLLALSSFTLSTGRRQGMAIDFFPQYRSLCATSRPFNEFLFGDDHEVTQATKQLKDAQSAELRLGYGAPSRGQPRGRFNSRARGHRGAHFPIRGRGRGPFLGGKAPHYRKRGAQGRPPQHQATQHNSLQQQDTRQ